MGAGASIQSHQDFDLNQYNAESELDVKAAVDKFMIHRIDSIIEQKEVNFPILRSKSTQSSFKNKRFQRSHNSIRAMSLRNHSRQSISYDLQKELAINLIILHKEEKNTARSTVWVDNVNPPINPIKSMDEKEIDETFLHPKESMKIPESPVILIPPVQNKIGLGLHSKRPPALKLIQDDSDWIQVTKLTL